MRSLHALWYVVVRGLRGMLHAPLVQIIAITTMAVCMMMLGAVMLAFSNARGVAQAWGVDVPMTAYFVDAAPDADIDAIVTSVAFIPEVESVTRVTPELAMNRLHEGLGSDSSLLDGITPEVLPTSIEIQLRRGVDDEVADHIAARLEASPVVDEVALTGAWAGRANDMLRTLRRLAMGAGVLVGLACMAIVWSTIRLGVYARRSEIQILRLCGGTSRFVHGPFLIEGMLQGACGAGVAIALLWLGFDAIHPFLEHGLSLMFAAGALSFFSPTEVVAGVAFGALVGAFGSRAAVARYVET